MALNCSAQGVFPHTRPALGPFARVGIRHGSSVRYEQPPHLPHDEAATVLEDALSGSSDSDASAVLIGLALFDDDHAFTEAWCRRIGTESSDPDLRGAAALSAGHLARPFGTLEPATQRMVRTIAEDPSVDGRKHDALEDMEQFLRGHS